MPKGLSEKIVREISARKNEPKWMLEFRLKSLKLFNDLPMPNFGPDLSGINIDDIESYVKPRHKMVNDWKDVPADIRKTFVKLGIPQAERAGLAGLGAQFDSELIYHNVKEAVKGQGVYYNSIENALHSKYRGIIHRHFMQLVKPGEHKFTALHGAVWSGGAFVYVPPHTTVRFPLQSYLRFEAPGAGQFEHSLIIVDEGAELQFIEACSAPKYNIANLHSGCVEIFVKKDARIKYTAIENWSKNMYNLNTKRALVDKNARIEWVTGSFGSHVSMLYPMTLLSGANSSMEYTGVTFSGAEQDLDNGMKAVHCAPNTSSFITAKSIAKDGGKNTFRSLVKVTKRAKNAKSFTDCQSLMLDSSSKSDTIPKFDIMNNSADIAHEANVGKISENEIYYLKTRGLSEAQARSLIVRGFTNDVSKELPFEYAS